MALTKVSKSVISDNAIDADKLAVTGNGNSGELLASSGDGTFQWTSGIATQLYTDNAIAALVDSAPGALDTLNELAAALGDDANFSTTVTNALATKVDGTGTTNYISKWSDSNTLTNSVIYDNGTNVGIGTSVPFHKLDVNYSGSFSAGGIITATYLGNNLGAGVANGFIASLNDAHGTTLDTGYHYEFQITTNGTGTQSGANYVVYYDTSSGSWRNRFVSISGGSSNHPLLTTTGNNVIIYDNHATGYSVRYNVKATFVQEDAASPHSLGAAYQWRRSVNDLFYDEGNVGIGTSSPTNPLHVYHASVDTVARFESGDPIVAISLISSDNSIVILTSGTDSIFRNEGAGNLRLFNNGSERMRIDTNGNVGIGTSSPAEKLHVANGDIYLQSEYDAAGITDSFLYIQTRQSGNWRNSYLGQTGNNLVFGTGGVGTTHTNATEKMRIDSSGNVGIGTSSPSGLLTVSNSSNTLMELSNDGNRGKLKLYRSGGTAYTQLWHNGTDAQLITTAGAIGFVNNSTEHMRIASNGNVGIGVTSPFRKLQVNGDANFVEGVYLNSLNPSVGATTTTQLMLQAKGNQNGFIRNSLWYLQPVPNSIYGNSGLSIKKGYDGGSAVEFIRINSGGNVGIGTTTPSAKLDVVGTIECTSLTETSALRFKENIQEDVDASIIDKLRPVSYDWKEDKKKDYGFIAEEVNELDSTLTTQNEEGEMLGIKYTKLIPFLVKKIQEQEERIKQLENGKS